MNLAKMMEEGRKWKKEVEINKKKQESERKKRIALSKAGVVEEIKPKRENKKMVFNSPEEKRLFYKRRRDKLRKTRLERVLKELNMAEPAPKTNEWGEEQKKQIEHLYFYKGLTKEQITVKTGIPNRKVNSYLRNVIIKRNKY